MFSTRMGPRTLLVFMTPRRFMEGPTKDEHASAEPHSRNNRDNNKKMHTCNLRNSKRQWSRHSTWQYWLQARDISITRLVSGPLSRRLSSSMCRTSLHSSSWREGGRKYTFKHEIAHSSHRHKQYSNTPIPKNPQKEQDHLHDEFGV